MLSREQPATVIRALCALVLFTRSAAADVASEAEFFDALGRRAYAAGKYAEALEAFALLREIAPSPGVLYNLALAADLAGKDDMAFSLFREYLSHRDPEQARRTEAKRRSDALERRLALVETSSDPEGAFVYVDRKELGLYGVTPVTIAVSAGDHRFLLEKAGFVAESFTGDADLGKVVSRRVTLTPLVGRATVSVSPPSASLRFSRAGTDVHATLEGGSYLLPTGTYRVVARADGFVPSESLLVVRENETSTLEIALAAIPRPTGSLLVSSGPLSAQVFLDGRRVAVTPATLSELGVGEHVVELRRGARRVSRRVRIRQGRTSYLALEVEPRP